ncbi:MAG: hypothetical protein QMC62_06270 [Alteromonadaceae bacterium]
MTHFIVVIFYVFIPKSNLTILVMLAVLLSPLIPCAYIASGYVEKSIRMFKVIMNSSSTSD